MSVAAAPTISPAAFAFIVEHVYRHSRIRLGPDKEALVVSRVIKRLRHLQISSFEDYCHLLKSAEGTAETLHLVDVVSTNHTQFFREKEHFEYLEKKILPAWVANKSNLNSIFRVWSAACSSGEEPYTLAMVLSEFFRSRPTVRWQIDASDICTRILAKATEAIYETEKLTFPDPALLPRYFQKGGGSHAGFCRAKAEIRDHVTFHHLNLFQERYPVASGLSVIFCRNVMIYFDQPSIHTLVNRLAEFLQPGGHLVVGLSESLLGVSHPLKQVRPGIYQKA